MTHNARLGQRIALRGAAMLTLLDETRLEAETVDLSLGGICLHVGTPVRLAQLCAVRFDVAEEGARRKILAMGQVVYCDADAPERFKAGIKFIKLDPQDVAVIAGLLRQQGAALPNT